METAKVLSNGRITIPKKIREKLRINTGTKVLFYEKSNDVYLVPLKKKSK